MIKMNDSRELVESKNKALFHSIHLQLFFYLDLSLLLFLTSVTWIFAVVLNSKLKQNLFFPSQMKDLKICRKREGLLSQNTVEM